MSNDRADKIATGIGIGVIVYAFIGLVVMGIGALWNVRVGSVLLFVGFWVGMLGVYWVGEKVVARARLWHWRRRTEARLLRFIAEERKRGVDGLADGAERRLAAWKEAGRPMEGWAQGHMD